MLANLSNDIIGILSKSKKGYFDFDYYIEEDDILLALDFLSPIKSIEHVLDDLETCFFYQYIEKKYGFNYYEDIGKEYWDEYLEEEYRDYNYAMHLIYETFYRYNISITLDINDITNIPLFNEIISKYISNLDYNSNFKIEVNNPDIPIPLPNSLKRSEFVLYGNKVYWFMGEMYSKF